MLLIIRINGTQKQSLQYVIFTWSMMTAGS